MPRVVTKLSPNKSGGFTARKRLPKDVQTDYERLYGIRWEERFNSESVPFALAKAKHREWLSEIEGRIANIRAERSGDGQRLTPMQARALAGEWYLWFTERHLAKPSPADHWEDYLGEVGDTINDELRPHGDATNPEEEDPDVVWRRYPDARRVVRPMLADWGETSRFLAARRIALDSTSRDLFLDCLYGDFAAALKLLIQRRRGDYTPDARPTRFPQFERSPDPGVTPWGLFEQWIEKTKPAISTVDRWRGVFVRLREDFPDRSAASLSQDEIRDWVGGLINGTRSPVTVREVWVAAGRTVYAWAKDQNIVSRNPFAELRVPVPRKTKSRETKAFHSTEIKTILSAALAVPDISRKSNAAKRWVPWICAYTGARSGEIT